MRYRVLAVLAASMLLLSGCGNKMTEVNSAPSGGDSAVSEQQGSTTGEGVTDAQGNAVTETGAAEGVDITDVKAQGGTTALNENAETQPFTPSADDDQEGAYGTAPADAANSGDSANPGDAAKPQEQTASQKGNPNGKLFVTVETVEVTLDQLKAQDYTVPLLINLDRNPVTSSSPSKPRQATPTRSPMRMSPRRTPPTSGQAATQAGSHRTRSAGRTAESL